MEEQIINKRTLKSIEIEINSVTSLSKSLGKAIFSFLDSESVNNILTSLSDRLITLEQEKKDWITESESIGQTYAESFGLENINWRLLIINASTDEDWKNIYILFTFKSGPCSVFDSRCHRFKKEDYDEYHYIREGSVGTYGMREIRERMWKDICPEDSSGALSCLESIYKIYRAELKKPGFIDIPSFH